jgi:hypothetical protein
MYQSAAELAAWAVFFLVAVWALELFTDWRRRK